MPLGIGRAFVAGHKVVAIHHVRVIKVFVLRLTGTRAVQAGVNNRHFHGGIAHGVAVVHIHIAVKAQLPRALHVQHVQVPQAARNVHRVSRRIRGRRIRCRSALGR